MAVKLVGNTLHGAKVFDALDVEIIYCATERLLNRSKFSLQRDNDPKHLLSI